MTEPMIRGYVVSHTANYFRTQCDPDVALRVDRELSIELRAALGNMAPAAWVPRRYQSQLLQAVAKAHTNAELAREDLVRCGFGLGGIDNPFMTLLVKLLTPELLLRKTSLFWTRDHRESGQCELNALDPDRHSGRLRLRGVAGYDHASLVWLGWIKRMLTELGHTSCEVTQQGWTWSTPGPEEINYEIKWS